MIETTTTNRFGFMNLNLGGTAGHAAKTTNELYADDGAPYKMLSAHLDTDPKLLPYFDTVIHLPLSEEIVDAVRSNPGNYGPEALTIVDEYKDYLDSEDIGNGAARSGH